MKTVNKFATVAAIFFLSACIKEKLNYTDHPEQGKIISINLNWADKGANVATPSSCKVSITSPGGDSKSGTLTGAQNTTNYVLAPADYHITIWNEADHIAVSSTTATADYTSGLLGWFFTGVTDLTTEADKEYTVDIDMKQQVRELTLALEPTGSAKDNIATLTATLSGVAGAIDINTGNPTGSAVTINLTFTKNSTDGKYYATGRLLGITGSTQKLTVTITYTNGNPSAQTVESDLSSQLSAFNTDKKTPLALGAQTVVTPTAGGFTAGIQQWTDVTKDIYAEY